MTKKELAQQIYKVAHLRGEFRLRSGQVSNEYFDKYRFEAQPEILREVANHMLPLINKNCDALAGLEMGGIPIATALSLASGLPVVFVRKAAKDYGTCQFAEGLNVKGLKLCIIEDVVTTGGQVIESTADLRQAGAIIEDVLCAIHRGNAEEKFAQNQLRLKPLFTKADFAEF